MLPSAYVLFNVESSCEDQVREQLKNLKEVKEVYVSYGVYDLIIKVTVDTMDELRELISYRLRKVENVRSTLSLILT
jgi:DNA-binding Lrp family transcriptional regulator